MKVFLTGGTGNIGQYVLKALSEKGHEVMAYTRTPDRIPAIKNLKGVTVVQGDILELDKMKAALQGCDGVIHIALGWGNTPVEMLKHDTLPAVFLLEESEKAGVKNFIHTSSTAVYGIYFNGMDETAQCLPDDLYGATKSGVEKYIIGFKQYYTGQGKRGKKVTMQRNVIRPGYTFSNPAFEGGASQSDTRFSDIARAVLKGEDLSFSSNDGAQFMSAQNIAEVYVKLLESNLSEQIILALDKPWTSWAKIAEIAKSFVPGSQSKITEIAASSDPEVTKVDRLEKIFGGSYNSFEHLREHIRWNVEREAKVLKGEEVHNVYHVW